MNNIDKHLTTLAEEYVNFYLLTCNHLTESKLNNIDVKTLFKYLATTRKDTRGLLTKIKDFSSFIQSSPAYNAAIEIANSEGAKADEYIDNKISRTKSNINSLVKSSDIGIDEIKTIEELSNVHKKYPKLAPMIFAVLSTVSEKLRTRDSDLDNFINMSKYNIGSYISKHQDNKQAVNRNFVSPADEYSKIMIAANISDTYRKSILQSYKNSDDFGKKFITDLFKRVLNTESTKRNSFILKWFPLLKVVSDNNISTLTRSKIINIVNGNISKKKSINYINTFLKSLSKSTNKEKYATQWLPYIEQTLQSKDINESSLYEFDGLKRKLKQLGQRTGILDKTGIDYNGLMKVWELHGNPNEIDEIIGILKDVGFSSREIKKGLGIIGVDIEDSLDVDIEKLYNIINKYDLSSYVLRFLDKFYPKDKAKFKLTESVSIKKSDIEKIFSYVVSNSSTPVTTDSQSMDLNYLYSWVKSLKKAPDDDKKKLVDDIVNYLSDNKDSTDWKAFSAYVNKTLQSANLDPLVLSQSLARIKSGFPYRKNTTETVNNETVALIDFLTEELDISHSYTFNESGNMYSLTVTYNDVNIDSLLTSVVENSTYGRTRK